LPPQTDCANRSRFFLRRYEFYHHKKSPPPVSGDEDISIKFAPTNLATGGKNYRQ